MNTSFPSAYVHENFTLIGEPIRLDSPRCILINKLKVEVVHELGHELVQLYL